MCRIYFSEILPIGYSFFWLVVYFRITASQFFYVGDQFYYFILLINFIAY